MVDQSNGISPFSQLINLLISITHLESYVDRMHDHAKHEKENNRITTVFYTKFTETDDLIDQELSEKLFNRFKSKIPLNELPTKTELEYLLWLILLFPCGNASESKIILQIKRTDLSALTDAYKCIFAKLMLEAFYNKIDLHGKKLEYYTELINIIPWLKVELNITDNPKKKNKKGRRKKNKNESGAYSFFLNAPKNHKYFKHFSLAATSFFFFKLHKGLDDALKKQEAALLKKQSGFNVTIKEDKHLQRFPPFWDILDAPITIMNQGLTLATRKNEENKNDDDQDISDSNPDSSIENNNKIEDIDPEDFTQEIFWNNILDWCLNNENVGNSFIRKSDEFKRFIEATEMHKTLWISPTDELLTESIVEMNDGPQTPDQDNYSRILGGLEVDPKKNEYIRYATSRKYIEFAKLGGLIRLRNCWDNRMRLTYDQICIFVGYLSRKGFEYVSIFLESLLTGASIKRILTKPEDLPKHLPAGLYRDISKQDLFGHIPSYDDFKKMMNDFNKQHKMFSFSLSRIPYTGKARLLDVKNLNLTPLETQHTSSSILPGMGSSLYYVQPDDNIVNRLDNANISFLNELIAFSKNGFIGPLKTYNELINRSTHFFQDRINTISLDRESIWADKKPTIFILPDNELLPIYKRLENNFLTANDPSSKLQAMECIAMYLTMLTLLLRPCETKRLLRDDYYDIFGILFVSGKGNKSYFESRILPVAASMQTFLDLYLKYIELDKVACLIMDNVQDKYLFPFPKETMDKLETILQDFDLNYTPYICRRTSATKLHNKLRPLFNIFQAIMGHSQSGFESAGLFSRIQFSSIRSVVETYSTDPVILEILPKAIKLLENSL